MKVKELIDWLGDFNKEAEVIIGMKQRYGSDFAMEISDVSQEKINPFYGEDDSTYVVITEGEQIGAVRYKDW